MNQGETYLLIKPNKDDEDYTIGINKKTSKNIIFTDTDTFVFTNTDSIINYVYNKYYNYCSSNCVDLNEFDGYVYVVNNASDARLFHRCQSIFSHDSQIYRSTKIIITQKYSLSDPATIDKLGLKINYRYIAIASAKGWIKILDLLKLPENKDKKDKITKIELTCACSIGVHYKCNEAINWWKNSGLIDNTTE